MVALGGGGGLGWPAGGGSKPKGWPAAPLVALGQREKEERSARERERDRSVRMRG